jgi:type IX secretion system PorP/SprF family membrane protein
MAIGVGVVFENQKIDVNRLVFNDENYIPPQGMSAYSMLTGRAGLLLFSKSFYFGISYLPLGPVIIQQASDYVHHDAYLGSAQTGVSIALTPEFILKPSVMALLYKDGGLQLDYNVKAFIRERLWLGVSYRDVESVVPMVGFSISDALSVSYAYEILTGDLKQFGDSSHELVLSIRLNNFKKLKQYTW